MDAQHLIGKGNPEELEGVDDDYEADEAHDDNDDDFELGDEDDDEDDGGDDEDGNDDDIPSAPNVTDSADQAHQHRMRTPFL